jgi:hypothetical protein
LWPSLVKVLEVLIHPPPLRRHPFPSRGTERNSIWRLHTYIQIYSYTYIIEIY